MQKRLLVNGVGMTHLTPITKMMAHLPLAFRAAPPAHGTLVICLGMGTTLRSALSWQAPATAVELIPSVVELAPYFHADARQLFASPLARIVVDDGRRFLARSSDLYDVIVIDPPPPVYAAGSSLLYSMEFYAAARQRLAEHGILQQWIPAGDRSSCRPSSPRSPRASATSGCSARSRAGGSTFSPARADRAADGRRARGPAAAGGRGRPPGVGPGGDGRRAVPAVLAREVALESIAGPRGQPAARRSAGERVLLPAHAQHSRRCRPRLIPLRARPRIPPPQTSRRTPAAHSFNAGRAARGRAATRPPAGS